MSPHSCRLRGYLAQPIPINHRRNFRRLDLAAAAPKNIGIRNRDIFRSEMRVDRRLVLEQSRFVSTVRDGHDIDVAKLRTAFAPVTMREDMMPSHLTTYFNLAARRHRPMKERVESRHSHTARARFHVFEERGKPADDFPSIQRFSHAIKFLERNSSLVRACGPWRRSNFFRRELPFQRQQNPPLALTQLHRAHFDHSRRCVSATSRLDSFPANVPNSKRENSLRRHNPKTFRADFTGKQSAMFVQGEAIRHLHCGPKLVLRA